MFHSWQSQTLNTMKHATFSDLKFVPCEYVTVNNNKI